MTGQVRLGRDTENGVAHSSGVRAECLRGGVGESHDCPVPHDAPEIPSRTDLPRRDLPKAPDQRVLRELAPCSGMHACDARISLMVRRLATTVSKSGSGRSIIVGL